MTVEQEETNKICGERRPAHHAHRFHSGHDGMKHLVGGFPQHTETQGEHESALRESRARLPTRRTRKHKEAEPIHQGIAKHVERIREKRGGVR